MSEEKTMIELTEIYRQYRNVGDQYYAQLCSKIGKFVEFANNPQLKPSDIDPTLHQSFLNHRIAEGNRSATVCGYHRAILAVVHLSDEVKNGRVCLPKPEHRITEGFSLEEIARQKKFAKSLKGELANGVKQKHFWLACINGGLSSGLRAGDMFAIASDDIPDDGILVVVQSKTGKPVTVRFNKAAIKNIRKHGQPEAFPWPHTFAWFEKSYAKFLRAAGVNRGTWKWWRRTAGSFADKNGNGHKLLGNTRAVFEKHYEVPEITSKAPPEQIFS